MCSPPSYYRQFPLYAGNGEGGWRRKRGELLIVSPKCFQASAKPQPCDCDEPERCMRDGCCCTLPPLSVYRLFIDPSRGMTLRGAGLSEVHRVRVRKYTIYPSVSPVPLGASSLLPTRQPDCRFLCPPNQETKRAALYLSPCIYCTGNLLDFVDSDR